jgi:hypothetical protein
MKTLSKKITSTFFKNSSDYSKLVNKWSQLINESNFKPTGSDFLIYLILRGKNWHKAFLPGKEMRDYKCPQGYWNATNNLNFSMQKFNTYFGDLLDSDWKKITNILPKSYSKNIYECDPYDDNFVEKMLMEKEEDCVA